MDPSSFLSWELFVFADAGFGTLLQNHTVESRVIILGDVIGRGGILKCYCLTLGHRCAKIPRVRRPTLSAGTHAAVTAVDVSLRRQVLLTEIFTREFNYRRLTHPTEFPSINPSRESPADDEVRKEASLGNAHSILVSAHTDNPMMTE